MKKFDASERAEEMLSGVYGTREEYESAKSVYKMGFADACQEVSLDIENRLIKMLVYGLLSGAVIGGVFGVLLA